MKIHVGYHFFMTYILYQEKFLNISSNLISMYHTFYKKAMIFEPVLINQLVRFEACSAEQVHCAHQYFVTRIGNFGERSHLRYQTRLCTAKYFELFKCSWLILGL